MKTISRYIMTLALLLTAVTGAWAQTPSVKLFTVPDEWAGDNTELTAADFPGFMDYSTLTNNEAKAIPNPDPSYSHAIILFYGFNETEAKYIVWNNGTQVANTPVPRKTLYEETTEYHCKIYYTKDPNFIDVKWDAATKSGTFTMPAYGVEIAPIYAPVAQWAKVENVDQLPTAIEGIFAGTTDAIVKAGTVAMMGETENPQGIVMYAVTSINQATAPALDAFSADVPTAGNIADEGADVLVWYYIQGANTPDGEEATAENTFNDSEICETPIKVTVLPNKYDIHFNAANDNTIEAGKATVTVGGTDKTGDITDGKLQGVKMGSEVKLEAKPGYKFRKVEVKKKGAPKYADVVTICEKNGDNKYLISSFFDGTNANITTITKEEAIALAEYLGGGNILVVYEEYEYYGDKYVMVTNAAGNVTGLTLSTTNTCNVPLYYVPAGN